MDYSRLGLKCGIEIHQQLSGKKLFCSCPAKINDSEPDLLVKRKLHAVIGETGTVDTAAAQEEARNRSFIYQAYRDCTCLIELDEEPPKPINSDALHTALLVAKMLHAKPVDEIQVMRKTVIDGSNTTGFQRTALVAMNGYIDISEGRISIPTISIEEEAAKIVDRKGDSDVYNLSRLGIPLIEIGTGPDLKTPEGVKEACEKLGLILRSTERVMRGIGTIRQDVNVSIEGGARIEIKGAQDLRMIPSLVENEALRQKSLLDIRTGLKRFNIEDRIHNVTQVFRDTQAKIIKRSESVFATRLPGFHGFLGKELIPGRRLGTEFSDYAKVAAGVGGIFHSDELPNYGITEKETEEVRRALKCRPDDAFVIVADSKEKSAKALEAVIRRAKMVFDGVPQEVRKANPDGTSSFMRPIPGEARMYPETDVMPIRPRSDDIELPELIEEKARRYSENFKLSKDLAMSIARSGKGRMLELFINEFKAIKPAFIAETIFSIPISLKKEYGVEWDIREDHFETLFSHLNSGALPKESIVQAMADIIKGRFDISSYQADSSELEKDIREIIARNKDSSFAAIMGEVMKKYRGRISGKIVSEAIRKCI